MILYPKIPSIINIYGETWQTAAVGAEIQSMGPDDQTDTACLQEPKIDATPHNITRESLEERGGKAALTVPPQAQPA